MYDNFLKAYLKIQEYRIDISSISKTFVYTTIYSFTLTYLYKYRVKLLMTNLSLEVVGPR